MREEVKVLLTGASGTVGKEVLNQLCEIDQFDITVFDIKTNHAKIFFDPYKSKIKIVYGDITNRKDVKGVCSEKDVVIHLAVIIQPLAGEKPKLAYNVNIKGTKNLIQTLERLSPEVFLLYSSSISVYGDRLKKPLIKVGDPLHPSEGDEYARTKIEAKKIIIASKLDWSIFRLAAVMGGHKISKLMFLQPLKTSFEIITPEDTARAFVDAINKMELLSRKIFNLGGGEKCRISYEEFLSRSFKIYGLGELDFPSKTFAEKNFHCGFYEDGNELNDILDFRRDTIDSYFEKESNKVSSFRKSATRLLNKPIKHHLLKQSEPYKAYTQNNKVQSKHFFVNLES